MISGRTPFHDAVYYCRVTTIKGRLLALMYLALSSRRQAVVSFFSNVTYSTL